MRTEEPSPSVRSRFSLNAVNFFLAQLTGIGSPYLSAFLSNRGWPGGAIGMAVSMSALGALLFQTHAGILLDHLRRPRLVLAAASVAVGLCYASLPLLPEDARVSIGAALFASGVAQSFFAPLLAGLALGLVGQRRLNRTMGSNQAWNHLGDVIAALAAFVLVRRGVSFVFFLVAAIACLAAISGFGIRRDEIDVDRARSSTDGSVPLRLLARDRRVLVLLASTTLFHLANASAIPFAALRLKHLGSSDGAVALLILVSQASMVPVALAAGWLLDRWGHKRVFTIGFIAGPLHVLACAVATEPRWLVAAQVLGGVGAGIFGVAIVAVSADLTRGTGRFHSLTGASRAALAGGAVVGPLVTGILVEHAGYFSAFLVLALVAAAGALLFIHGMPETRVMRPGVVMPTVETGR